MPFVEFEKDHMTFDELLVKADLAAQFMQLYQIGEESFSTPNLNFDPGRIRSEKFFTKMYGSTNNQIEKGLTTINWNNQLLQVSTKNKVELKFKAVLKELKSKPKLVEYLHSSGTYLFRNIAGTHRLSMHSFGIAIDIFKDTPFYKYWQWDKHYQYPKVDQDVKAIVEIFEKQGFIWGGKWYHYDYMHFEYRPELLCLSKNLTTM